MTEAREIELIFRLAGPLRGRQLLDAGCGDGIYLVEAARRGALPAADFEIEDRGHRAMGGQIGPGGLAGSRFD